MRRLIYIGIVLLAVVSLGANGLLGYFLVRSQKDYLALSREFVKARQGQTQAEQQLQKLQAQVAGAKSSNSAPSPAAPVAPAAPAEPTLSGASAGNSTASSPSANPSAAEGVAVIRDRYLPNLQAVQAECEGQLNDLLAQAKADYQQAKTAGKVDVAALGAKYLGRADSLRRTCDRKVDSVLAAMSGELKAQGLPLDLVDQVRQEYEAQIVQRQAEIMAKAPAQ